MSVSNSLFRYFVGLLGAMAPLSGNAAHPLITEDTGTQGAGRSQLEVTSEHTTIRQNGANQSVALSSAILAYGVVKDIDVILTVPYLWLGQSGTGATPAARGLADLGLDVKWRFYEKNRLSIAFKPGITFPSGDDTRNLGTGKHTWSAYFTASYEAAPWTYHLHFGHVNHNNTYNEREDIWHISTAVVRQAGKTFKLILDLGVDTNTERHAETHPAFLIAGFIYTPQRHFDIDVGYKTESTDSRRGRALLAGLTLRW